MPKRKSVPKRKPARKPAKASFPQRAEASPKQLVLFELIRARAALHAALQGLVPGQAGAPMGAGKWSIRETVLHLITRDQARLRELEAALRGLTPSWKGADDARMGAINAELLAPITRLEWEEALRLLQLTRLQLIEAVESVPEESAEVWADEHPFGWMLRVLPAHDRHHADIIKRWRARRA